MLASIISDAKPGTMAGEGIPRRNNRLWAVYRQISRREVHNTLKFVQKGYSGNGEGEKDTKSHNYCLN